MSSFPALGCIIACVVAAGAGCDSTFGLVHVADPVLVDANVEVDGPAPPTTRVYPLLASDDDSYQDAVTTLVDYSWVSLRDPNLFGAFRFQLVDVAQGAVVEEAYLEMFIDSDTEDSPMVTISAEAGESAPLLDATPNDISARVRGNAQVPWVAPDLGAGYQRSPRIDVVVQERLDDVTWPSRSSILIIFESVAGSAFEVRQYDFAPAGTQSARLHLTFRNP